MQIRTVEDQFEAFFDALAALSESAHLVQMFDSTVARAHVSAAGAKGGQDDQALGRSRGGFSTKIHLKVDLDGLPLAFHLTGGEASDSRNFELLLDIGPDILPRAAITDKGYDAKSNRDGARKRGICPSFRIARLQPTDPFLPENPLQSAGAHRAGRRCYRRRESAHRWRRKQRRGGQPSTSVVEYGWVASPVKAGLRPPPPAADGLDTACHPAIVCHQAFDCKEQLR